MNKLADALEGGPRAWQGASYVRIEGATDIRDRHEAVKRFRTDPSIRVALLSVTAAGGARAWLLAGWLAGRAFPCSSAATWFLVFFACILIGLHAFERETWVVVRGDRGLQECVCLTVCMHPQRVSVKICLCPLAIMQSCLLLPHASHMRLTSLNQLLCSSRYLDTAMSPQLPI